MSSSDSSSSLSSSLTPSSSSEAPVNKHLSVHDMDAEIRKLQALLEEKTSIGGYSKVDDEIRRVKKEIADPTETMTTSKLGDMKHDDRVVALLKIAQEKAMRKEETLQAQFVDKQEEAVKRIGYQLQENNQAYVCFLIDLTASMGVLLPTIKDLIKIICQYLKDLKITGHYAVVGYRDEEQVRNIIYHDFSEEQFMLNFLDLRVKACTDVLNSTGTSPDLPEDMIGGFDTVQHLAWPKPKPKYSKGIGKAIIHFADAPCHGSQYHLLHDNSPNVFGSPLEEHMIHLARCNINYSLFSASHANDKMIEVMKQAFGRVRNESVDFHVTDVLLAVALLA